MSRKNITSKSYYGDRQIFSDIKLAVDNYNKKNPLDPTNVNREVMKGIINHTKKLIESN